jgi:hypothetical protein
LNKFFKSIGTTKQVFHVKLNRYMQKEEEMGQLSLIVFQVRKDHPGMGLRDLYHMIQPTKIGRDRFEQYFMQMGYGVVIKRSFRRLFHWHQLRCAFAFIGSYPEDIKAIQFSAQVDLRLQYAIYFPA